MIDVCPCDCRLMLAALCLNEDVLVTSDDDEKLIVKSGRPSSSCLHAGRFRLQT